MGEYDYNDYNFIFCFFSFSYDVSFETFLSGDNVFHGLYISSHSWASLTGSQRKPLCNLLQSRNFTQFVRTSSKRPLQNMNIHKLISVFPQVDSSCSLDSTPSSDRFISEPSL